MAEKDYPAGHSTDSSWYAIDECGHVAACFTSESGALPENAVEIGSYEEEEGSIAFWNGECHVVETISSEHVGLLAKTFSGAHRDPKYGVEGLFYILTGLPGELRPFLLRKEGRPTADPIIRMAGKHAIAVDFGLGAPALAFYEKVHALGLCVACTSAYHLSGSRVGKKGDPVFSYGHPSANGAAWPYFLQYAPQRVKTLEGLSISKEERKALRKGIVIPGCFRDKIFWQPADDFECTFYSDDTKPISVDTEDFKGILRSPFGYW